MIDLKEIWEDFCSLFTEFLLQFLLQNCDDDHHHRHPINYFCSKFCLHILATDIPSFLVSIFLMTIYIYIYNLCVTDDRCLILCNI